MVILFIAFVITRMWFYEHYPIIRDHTFLRFYTLICTNSRNQYPRTVIPLDCSSLCTVKTTRFDGEFQAIELGSTGIADP